jgi:hypothetical protein
VALLGWLLMWTASLSLNTLPARAITGGQNITCQNGSCALTGQVPAANGGTGLDTSASTGVPTINTGTWSISAQVPVGKGGTGADLSATGGANQFLKQSSVGGTVSVGTISDNDVPDNITASSYLPLAGGTLTGQLVTDNLGIEFDESDTNPGCTTGNYNIFADLSENKLKKCQDGVASDLDTTTTQIKPLIGFGTGMPLTSGSTVYIWPGLVDATEANVAAPTDAAATFENINCRSSTAPGGSDTFTITIGTGTCGSISYTTKAQCQISASGTTCDSGASTSSTTAGQCVAIRAVASATAANATISCTAERIA